MAITNNKSILLSISTYFLSPVETDFLIAVKGEQPEENQSGHFWWNLTDNTLAATIVFALLLTVGKMFLDSRDYKKTLDVTDQRFSLLISQQTESAKKQEEGINTLRLGIEGLSGKVTELDKRMTTQEAVTTMSTHYQQTEAENRYKALQDRLITFERELHEIRQKVEKL